MPAAGGTFGGVALAGGTYLSGGVPPPSGVFFFHKTVFRDRRTEMMERRGRSADSRFFFGYHSGILGTPKRGMPRETRFLTIAAI